MRYMFIVTSAHVGPPTPALLTAMGKLADRETKAGRMVDNAGLMPLATGARVRIGDGKLNVLDGPFVEAKEVIGGYVEHPRLITRLARMLRDVPLAEELTQEALLAALETWPGTGVPERPGAWLMATAKRRALDHLRRDQMLKRKHQMLALDGEEDNAMPDLEAALDDDIGDELLRLIFTACHPLLSHDSRTALALRMICGLTTEEIARAAFDAAADLAVNQRERDLLKRRALSAAARSQEK